MEGNQGCQSWTVQPWCGERSFSFTIHRGQYPKVETLYLCHNGKHRGGSLAAPVSLTLESEKFSLWQRAAP